MDIPNSTRLRPKKSTTTAERFFGAYPQAPPHNPNPATASPSPSSIGDELNEDDIFWTNDYAAESTPPSSTSSTPRHHHHLHHHPKGGFSQPESFGILAALPEREHSSSNSRPPHSHFYHKSSVSSSASSSPSQLIPAIPKPWHDRFNPPPLSSVKYHQSAPVNVPVLANAMRKQHGGLEAVEDDDDDDNNEVGGEMLPPHELVARSSAHSPMLACSVLEGVGRTLKGRDLRRVRNAVWRQTEEAEGDHYKLRHLDFDNALELPFGT